MGVHDCFVSPLVGLDKSVSLERSPKFGSEDLTEESPRPQTLNQSTFTIRIELLL